MKQVIYIAGPMTGLPDYNYPAFYEAEAQLEQAHPLAVILNPARNFKGRTGLPWVDYMRRSLRQVSRATHLHLLPGWESSRGATLEVQIAEALKLPKV